MSQGDWWFCARSLLGGYKNESKMPFHVYDYGRFCDETRRQAPRALSQQTSVMSVKRCFVMKREGICLP